MGVRLFALGLKEWIEVSTGRTPPKALITARKRHVLNLDEAAQSSLDLHLIPTPSLPRRR
jgi:hypothetical protein